MRPSVARATPWLLFGLWLLAMAGVGLGWRAHLQAGFDHPATDALRTQAEARVWPRTGRATVVLPEAPCPCDAEATRRLARWSATVGIPTVTLPTPGGSVAVLDGGGGLRYIGDAWWLLEGCAGERGWQARWQALVDPAPTSPVVFTTGCACPQRA